MELNIVHLYPDCMSLYGEYANVAVLRRHLEQAGVAVTVRQILLDDEPELAGGDFLYLGAGTERTQKAVLMALKDHADKFRAALEGGAVALFTGNAMETLGRSVTDGQGQQWPGLGLAEFTTVETDRRITQDVIAHTTLIPQPVVGFMNKCSHTTGVSAPLFSHLSLGFGNEGEGGGEGYVEGNLFATHLTGPVLAKNPALLELMLERLFAAKGWAQPECWPVLPHEGEAYAVTLRELTARVPK